MSTELVSTTPTDTEDSHMFSDFSRLFSKASNAIVQEQQADSGDEFHAR